MQGKTVTKSMGGESYKSGRVRPFCMGLVSGNRASRSLRAVLIATGCALLVGCGGPQLAAPDNASTPSEIGTPLVSTAPVPEASPVSSLGEIVWAASADPVTNTPQETVTTYSPEAPRISAFVLTTALPSGAAIEADWEYNDTSLDAFSRQIVVPTTTDQAWVSFHIDRGDAEPWPAGIYEVTISLNGKPVREAAVEVVTPA
jgi:hypothetical protein